jgi:hypothetical protein
MVGHSMNKTRRENIERCKAAGVAVGEYSELDKSAAQIARERRERKERRQRGRKRRGKARQRREEGKSNEDIRRERDALSGGRRLPGSFENGERR